MRKLLVGVLMIMLGAALLYVPRPTVYMKDGRDSPLLHGPSEPPLSLISSNITIQETNAPDSFDDSSRQPRSIYDPTSDKTRVRLHRDPKLDQEVIHIVTKSDALNVREVPPGSDWGPDVRTYLEYCDVHQAAWWCAAFVSYEIHEASVNSGVKANWPAFASCVDIYKWGKRHKLLLVKPNKPSVMLIPGNRKKHERRYKHTGIVVDYDPDNDTITTVEGNSNDNGSKNGIGVFQLHRRVKKGMVFVKIN